MTSEQKARALACIEQAGKIGTDKFFNESAPCCSVGWLLNCVGVDEKTYTKAVVNMPLASLPRRHPELVERFGLTLSRIMDITTTNDLTLLWDRRAAVLALISSWEVEDGPN